MLKSILFYYANMREFVKIKSIKISRARSKGALDERFFSDDQFSQVLDSSFKLNYEIRCNFLTEMLNENARGQAILIAVSYILIANTNLSESEKFEKLWKAFNRIYTYISESKNDHYCLKYLRNIVLRCPDVLIYSRDVVNTLSTLTLRNAIRWRAMILDNYDTESKTNSFKDFVLRYTDKRIMEILLQANYGYREDNLRKYGCFDEVNLHINTSIGNGIQKDDEVIMFLTGKYMYFVRNKTFHGEKIDSSFRLSVNEDQQMNFLNSILEPYLIDLINGMEVIELQKSSISTSIVD